MPTRYLKPGICDSETIDRCSPIAECLFYRLLVNVDDFGRLDARPAVIRAKCFPLKDVTLEGIQDHLSELQQAGLIKLYKSDDCIYLQMCKWDNIPRAKESKCPAPTDDCIQLHTSVNELHTVLPVTVTVTGTETVNRKPELKPKLKPEPGSVAQKSAPTQKAVLPESEIQTACRETWKSYSDAYFLKYDVEPVRNAKVNSQIKSFVGRLGFEDAPHVAAFFLQSRTAYYLQRGHSIDCLLSDAEKLRTEWATGRSSITATMARHEDRTQSVSQVVEGAMKILEEREHDKAKLT